MKLEFFVKNKRITRKGLEPLVGDTAGHYTFTVDFDQEWDGLVKVVVFRNGNDTAELIYTGESPLPAQVSGRGELYVACHGYRKTGDSVAVIRTIRMTRPVRLLGSAPMAGNSPEVYVPTVYEQVMAAAGQAQAAAEAASQTAAELLQLRDRGAFRGEDGTAATICVAGTEIGKKPAVVNMGTARDARLLFTLPMGADGRGVASVTGNPDGSWNVIYTDGTTETVSNEAYLALKARLDEAQTTPSDWSAAENEPGHIQNRTHWSEWVPTVLVDNYTIDGGAVFDFSLVSGQSYHLECFGEEYDEVAKEYEIEGEVYVGFGNDEYFGGENDGRPYAMAWINGIGSIAMQMGRYDETFVLTLSTVQEVTHRIHDKYLPDTKPYCISVVSDLDLTYFEIAQSVASVEEAWRSGRDVILKILASQGDVNIYYYLQLDTVWRNANMPMFRFCSHDLVLDLLSKEDGTFSVTRHDLG